MSGLHSRGRTTRSQIRQRRSVAQLWHATYRLAVLTGMTVALLAGMTSAPARAEGIAEQDPDDALVLARRYAPVMMLKAQEQECDQDGEPYGPTSIDIVLDNPEVVLRQLGPGDPVIMNGPGASDLFELGRGFFVDFPGSALEPGCVYEEDFRKYSRNKQPVVYAHVVQQEEYPDQIALQYWFYWYYNDWNNKHESDWEGIQLLFDAATVAEALDADPVSIGYAQHEGGETAEWDASKLEREGNRPLVYSSAGSHASYFGSAHYLGRSGSEGFGCDVTDGPSDRVDPDVVLLPDSVDDPDDPLAWLAFDGRWGERQNGPFNGPTGPAAKGRWLDPVDWHQDLRTSSVIVPGGDSQASAVVSAFCGVVEWGSGTLISFSTSPLKLVISAVLMLTVLSWAAGRTIWSRAPFEPLRRRRRAGQIIRLAFSSYRRMPGVLVKFGLVYLPAAALAALFGAIVAIVPLVKDAAGLAGQDSGTSIVLAFIAGGIPQLIALVLISAMMAVYLDRAGTDEALSPADAARLAWARRRELAGGLLRASAVVVGLLVTVVGTPWAIRQVVRYQFMPHAVMLEDRDGKSALASSSDLVRGRWWHTGLVVALLNAVVIAVNLLVGVVLLVIFSGLPLWIFSTLVTLAYGLVVPVTALALTLLYGDAVTEQQPADDRELVSA